MLGTAVSLRPTTRRMRGRGRVVVFLARLERCLVRRVSTLEAMVADQQVRLTSGSVQARQMPMVC
jgi:hypothetical protein